MKFRRIRAGPAGDWDSESGDRPGPSAAGRRPPAASVMMGRRFKTDFNSNRNVSLGLLSELSGDVKGWQSKSSAEFKRSELAILLSRRGTTLTFPEKLCKYLTAFVRQARDPV